MLNQLTEILKSSSADAWEVTETVTDRWEFYFIRHALDQNRAVHTESYRVRVFRTGGDGRFLGSAAGEIPATADEKEIRRLTDQMLLAAGLVKNPAYRLNQPSGKNDKPASSAPVCLPEISSGFLSALSQVPETESEDLNSSEVFVSSVRKRFLNSEGIDVVSEYPSSMVEAVVNARQGEREIELYRMYTSGTCDPARLQQDLTEVLAFGRARLQAIPTPALEKADVVFTTDAAREIYGWYADRVNAAYKYVKYSDWEIGQPVTGEASGDPVTLTAVPFLPNSSRNFAFDAEGARVEETVLIQDNTVRTFLGSRQYSQYLGLEHSFLPGNLKISGGKDPADTLRQGNFLEPVEFSDFQVNPLTGDVAGEIRLAFWHHDGQITPVTGGSVSGNMKQFAKTIRFSRETKQYDWWEIPAVTRLKDVTVTGVE